jgi:excinuclease ABC subunit A
VDLGPEAGEGGGHLVACGTPEEVAASNAGPTAPYLREALDGSPREERVTAPPVGAPRRAATAADPATTAQTPWELDGEKWHTRERVNEQGESPAWHDEALMRFAALWRSLPRAPEPDWSDRNTVTLKFPGTTHPFGVVDTSRRWSLDIKLNVPKGLFDEDDLEEELDLAPWDQVEGLRYHGRGRRVRLYTGARDHDRIHIQAHFERDVTSEGFERFLKRAWEAALKAAGRGRSSR